MISLLLSISIFATNAHAAEEPASDLRGSRLAKAMAPSAIWGTASMAYGGVAFDAGFYPNHNDFLLYTGFFAGVGGFTVVAVSQPLGMLGNAMMIDELKSRLVPVDTTNFRKAKALGYASILCFSSGFLMSEYLDNSWFAFTLMAASPVALLGMTYFAEKQRKISVSAWKGYTAYLPSTKQPTVAVSLIPSPGGLSLVGAF